MDYNKQAVCIMSANRSDIIKQNIEMYKDDLHMLQSSHNPNRDLWREKD